MDLFDYIKVFNMRFTKERFSATQVYLENGNKSTFKKNEMICFLQTNVLKCAKKTFMLYPPPPPPGGKGQIYICETTNVEQFRS